MTELPRVRQLVMFRHGVAYVERGGPASDSFELVFKKSEMNDVLKSLTVNVQGNGTISGLRYDSSIPTQNKLAELPFPTGDRQPLSSLLDHLRGSQLELRFGAQTVVGTIVSARQTVTKESGEREVVTVLTNDSDIRTLDLSAASSVRFLDAKLQLADRTTHQPSDAALPFGRFSPLAAHGTQHRLHGSHAHVKVCDT